MHFVPCPLNDEPLSPLFGPYMVESPTRPQPQSLDSWDIDSDMELAVNRVWHDINASMPTPHDCGWGTHSEMELPHNKAWQACKNEPPFHGPSRRRRGNRRSRHRRNKTNGGESAATFNPCRLPRPYSVKPWNVQDSVFKVARLPSPRRPTTMEHPSYETLPYPSEVAIRRPYNFNDDAHRPLPSLDDLAAIANWIELIPTHLRHITLQELQWLQHQVSHYNVSTEWRTWYRDQGIRQEWLDRDWAAWSKPRI